MSRTGFYIFAGFPGMPASRWRPVKSDYSSKFVFGFILRRIIRLTDNPSRRIISSLV